MSINDSSKYLPINNAAFILVSFPVLPMTLARITERLEEEQNKVGKTDGRRFNSRSRTKMHWEISNIKKSIRAEAKRQNSTGGQKGAFTKQELVEYKQIRDEYRQTMCRERSEREMKSQKQTNVKNNIPTEETANTVEKKNNKTDTNLERNDDENKSNKDICKDNS